MSLQSDDFLERKRAEAMLTEVEDNGYALGWGIKKDGCHFDHTGNNDPGYKSYLSGYSDFSGI